MHIGHFGPGVFRKDFNLNAPTNDYGWFQRYSVSFSGIAGGVGTELNGKRLVTDPETFVAPNFLFWRSPGKLIGTNIYEIRLLIEIKPGSYFRKSGELFVRAHGVVYSFNSDGIQIDALKDCTWYGVNHSFTLDPDWFPFNPPLMLIQPITWPGFGNPP